MISIDDARAQRSYVVGFVSVACVLRKIYDSAKLCVWFCAHVQTHPIALPTPSVSSV